MLSDQEIVQLGRTSLKALHDVYFAQGAREEDPDYLKVKNGVNIKEDINFLDYNDQNNTMVVIKPKKGLVMYRRTNEVYKYEEIEDEITERIAIMQRYLMTEDDPLGEQYDTEENKIK